MHPITESTAEIAGRISGEQAAQGITLPAVVADSVGEVLALKYGESSQVMSYVLPLLIEEGYCTVSDGKPFVIHRA